MPLRGKAGDSRITVRLGADAPVGRATAQRAAEYFAHYMAEGAAHGAGGRWVLAGTAPEGALEQLGMAPGQPWTQDGLEAALLGAGRGGLGRGDAVMTNTLVMDLPKSLSLLACYGEGDWLAATLRESVQVALDVLVQETTLVRRRVDGEVVRERAAGLLASVVVEPTARGAVSADGGVEVSGQPSPHWHAHVLLHSAVRQDGRLVAPDLAAAYQDGTKWLASAAADLHVRLRALERGYPLRLVRPDPVRGGCHRWEVATVPDAAIAIASERSAVIQEARSHGAGDRAAELLTKQSKTADPAGLDGWRQAIEKHGAWHSRCDQGPAEQPSRREVGRTISEGAAAAFRNCRLLTSSHLRAEVLNRCDARWGAGEVARIAAAAPEQLLASGHIVQLADGRLAEQATRDRERATLASWTALGAAPAPDRSHLAQGHLEGLDPGQQALVRHALSHRTTLGVGVAGSGKTTAVAALVQALDAERDGRSSQAHMLAVASLRAAESREATGAHAAGSIEQFLWRERCGTLGRHWKAGDVVVADEASQIPDRVLDTLLRAATVHGTSLVLLGDSKQQTPIEEGVMFAELSRRGLEGEAVGLVELQTAHRFRDPEQAAGLARLRAGDARPWAAYARERGWISLHCGLEASAQEIVRRWEEDPARLVLTTGSNERRDALGDAIVAGQRRRGEVGDAHVDVQPDAGEPGRIGRTVRLYEGERVRLNQQLSGRREVLAGNGEVAVLAAVHPERVTLRFDDGRQIDVRSSELVATHACVVQGYKATGMTAERTVVDLGEGTSLQTLYPALSRQREECRVVVTTEAPEELALGTDVAVERLERAAAQDRTPQATIAWAERPKDQVAVEPLDPEVIRRATEREVAAPVSEPAWWASVRHTPMRDEQEERHRRMAVGQEKTAGRVRGGRGRDEEDEE